jgi:GTP cyclohydrolase II
MATGNDDKGAGFTGEHIILTSHLEQMKTSPIPINWGEKEAHDRGPILGTNQSGAKRNAIGSHSGSYTIYRALSIAAGHYPKDHRPDLENTSPTTSIGPFDTWSGDDSIVSIDPLGAHVYEYFKDQIVEGLDIRPTIAVTQAHLNIPEILESIKNGELKPDGDIVKENGEIKVTKVAFEPVWYLPGVAKRLGVEEGELRNILFQETGGMFPELITRPDLKILLPPIGSTTAYIFGDPKNLSNKDIELTCRVHDECNGSDVFGSDICTCRPYLTYGIQKAAEAAQKGQTGLVVYYRKEGRALGEVTKFLVYNARKRQEGGDTPANYFHRTECVAGVQDARFQELMPDILLYFGVKKIHHLHSMSNMKYDAIVNSGIEVVNRLSIPDHLIPADAQVEMQAKKAAGYFSDDGVDEKEFTKTQGRELEEKTK